MVHRDQDHQPKQPILGNIVQALTIHRLGSTGAGTQTSHSP
jgi:hypothetical protein